MNKPSSYKTQKNLGAQLGFGSKILIVLLLGITFKGSDKSSNK